MRTHKYRINELLELFELVKHVFEIYFMTRVGQATEIDQQCYIQCHIDVTTPVSYQLCSNKSVSHHFVGLDDLTKTSFILEG